MTIYNESKSVELALEWAHLTIETAQLNYEIATDNIRNHVAYESADYDVLMEAAAEKVIQKQTGAVQVVVEKVKKFINGAIEKLKNTFSKKVVSAKVNEMKSNQNDPNVKNIEVECEDLDEMKKNIDELGTVIKRKGSGEELAAARAKVKKKCKMRPYKIAAAIGIAALSSYAVVNLKGMAVSFDNKCMDLSSDKLATHMDRRLNGYNFAYVSDDDPDRKTKIARQRAKSAESDLAIANADYAYAQGLYALKNASLFNKMYSKFKQATDSDSDFKNLSSDMNKARDKRDAASKKYDDARDDFNNELKNK